jgi:gluconolactonase
MRKKFYLLLFFSLCFKFSFCQQFSGIEHLVAKDATVEKVKGGFGFLEGPVADKYGNLYFSDIPNRKVYVLHLNGEIKEFIEDSGGSNGLAFDWEGNLVLCEDLDLRLTKIDSKGTRTVLADRFQGKKFNGPNDLYIDNLGGIYFTDPLYGEKTPELESQDVYYLAPQSKNVILAATGFKTPNGIMGLPDENKVLVADRAEQINYIFDVEPDGTLTNKTYFSEEGSDGITRDELGNFYFSAPRNEPDFAVAIYNRDGKKLGEIVVPEKPGNMHFAGKNKDILYITARTSLYMIKMNIKGIDDKITDTEITIKTDLPVATSRLLSGEKVNSNRDYTFNKIDEYLNDKDMLFLPHRFHQEYEFSSKQNGIALVAIESKNGEPLNTFIDKGWVLTDYEISVNGIDQKPINLHVLKYYVNPLQTVTIPEVDKDIHFPPFIISNKVIIN